MLLLTRKVGEKIRINDDITLVVLGINGMQVRLGIEAPKGVEVHREEIYQRIQAARTSPIRPSSLEHYSRLAAEAKVQP